MSCLFVQLRYLESNYWEDPNRQYLYFPKFCCYNLVVGVQSPGENDVLFIIGIQYFFQFHSAYGSRIDFEMAAPAKLNEFQPSNKYFILFLCHQNPDKKLEKWRKSYFIIPDLGSSQMTGTNVDNFILLCSFVTKRSMGERILPVRKMKIWVGKYMIHDNNNKTIFGTDIDSLPSLCLWW